MLLPFVSCAIFAGWCTSFNFVEMEYQSMIVSERKRLVQQRFPIVKSNLLISVMICCHCDVKPPGIAGINPLPNLVPRVLSYPPYGRAVVLYPGSMSSTYFSFLISLEACAEEREPENAAVSWWYKLTSSLRGKKRKIIRSRLLQFIDFIEKMMHCLFLLLLLIIS